MPTSKSETGAVLLSVTQSVVVFSALLPSFPEVRRATDQQMRDDVRMGEVASTALVVGIGFTASSMTGKPAALIASIAAAAVLVAVYETALHTKPTTKGPRK